MSKVYTLWETDITEFSDIPDILIGIYKSIESAELAKQELIENYNKKLHKSELCGKCPASNWPFNKDDAIKYCKLKFNKVPEIESYALGLYCKDTIPSPSINSDYYIKPYELND